jgi:hypothetical protein
LFHAPDLESLKAHVLAFVTAYDFSKHLKRLQWRTPFQIICEAWTKDPAPFKINPHHLIPGPHTFACNRQTACFHYVVKTAELFTGAARPCPSGIGSRQASPMPHKSD